MADERDLELLDDYLSHRMGGADRTEFEQKMEADPDLQSEYALQKALLQGIRDARISELKTMLRNVPVPAGGDGSAFTTKAVLGALSIILVAAAYWFLTRDETQVRTATPAAEQQIIDEQSVTPPSPSTTDTQGEGTKAPVEKPRSNPDKNQTSAGTEHSRPSLSKKPDPILPPAGKRQGDRSLHNDSQDAINPGIGKENSPTGDAEETGATLQPFNGSLIVETVDGNSSYTFHYQFRDERLFLYGPFRKDQYDITEFLVNDQRATFLHYNNRYYALERGGSDVKSLTPLADPLLLEQLEQYHRKQ